MDQATVQQTIDQMVRRIVDGFDPERIILFGSHARGKAGPDSDVDLLVVINLAGSCRRKATEIDIALVGLNLPVDVIVATPEQVDRGRNRMATVIRPALQEGKVLYERTG